jgi:hypothetical protein
VEREEEGGSAHLKSERKRRWGSPELANLDRADADAHYTCAATRVGQAVSRVKTRTQHEAGKRGREPEGVVVLIT